MPLQIIRDDLTRVQCDAVVNPTNERLHGSGYLEGKLREAAGEGLGQAMERIGSCAPGDAVITRGFDLPARWVIHTVGPGDARELLPRLPCAGKAPPLFLRCAADHCRRAQRLSEGAGARDRRLGDPRFSGAQRNGRPPRGL